MATEAVIGRRVCREDGAPKVTGRATFAGDLALPGLLHCRLVLSTQAHARIVSVDTVEAKQVPGVIGVYTADDLPLVEPAELTRSRDPLARDRTFFDGHPVVAVVAETEAAAADAAGLVVIEYEELEAAIDLEETLHADRELV